ncbi:MAG: N(4)-(beta-N-acetylglucosaminyl)-L-asparaginase [Ignavibacteria bacterium]|nr:N(4)-(beta-N-acetylglucosaminyl)-L-asparaginase [Ignavibacteria bacterium]
MKDMDRRGFITSATMLGVGAAMMPAIAERAHGATARVPLSRPVVISSANGVRASARAMELLRQGADTLDAVIAGVNIVEDDPNDDSVGYGGLPNEDGVVELDASVMHGPTCRGGAVASLRNIKNPSKIAKLVMERSDHVLIVGDGALRFAKAHGFKEEDLLTEQSRRKWLEWKERLSTEDDWLPAHDAAAKDVGAVIARSERLTGTIHCAAVDAKGDISAVTTTSGLAFKIPGRVGDSPILGAGLYVDNAVGAAGSTGRGEANLLSCASVMIVEWMRLGKSPEEACLLAATRVVDHTKMRRLLTDDGRPAFNVRYYAVNKAGQYGSASIYGPGTFAVNTGEQASRLLDGAYLFKTPEKQ